MSDAINTRFADNPLVTQEPNLRLYAGAPLKTPEGHHLGALFVISLKPSGDGPDGILSPVDRSRFSVKAIEACRERGKNPEWVASLCANRKVIRNKKGKWLPLEA